MTTKTPTNLNELIAYLETHPMLRARRPGSPEERVTFTHYQPGSLWYIASGQQARFLPIGCRTGGSETGLQFDAEGFTCTKFGVALRFEYDPAPVGFPPPEDEDDADPIAELARSWEPAR